MRVAVVDIGTNSTRLLVADVAADGGVTELDRRSTVTRLGQGVDASGVLAPEAMERVFATLGTYREAMDDLHVQGTTAVLTSAVRDAANGAAFTDRVREEFRLEAATLSGDEEAALSFLGATSARPCGRARADRRRRHRRRVHGVRGRRAGRRVVPRLHPGGRGAPRRAPPAHGPARPRGPRRARGRRPRALRRGRARGHA
jgi:hypothetical protein